MRVSIGENWNPVTKMIVSVLFLCTWAFWMAALLELPISRDSTGWKTVTHEEYGFPLDYPAKWLAKTHGEHGYKGFDPLKLRIYESNLGGFRIYVLYQSAKNPTLDEVTINTIILNTSTIMYKTAHLTYSLYLLKVNLVGECRNQR